MIRLRPMLVLCAVLALTVGVATATAGEGNPPKHQKRLCKEGGWQDWVRAEDQTAFQSKHDCYSYVAHGGTLTLPVQALCESYGGTFGATNLTVFLFTTVVWSCNGWPATNSDFNTKTAALHIACQAINPLGTAATSALGLPGPANTTCGTF